MLMRSLLRQLTVLESSVPSDVHERFIKRQTEGEISLEIAVQLITELFSDRPVTFIIDALDESIKKERKHLFKGLRDILQKSSRLVKIFVSSQDDYDLFDFLSDYPNMSVKASINKEDVEKFVEKKVDEPIDEKPKSLLATVNVSDSLRKLIKKTLCNNAQGM